jgi:hypothetical protein
MELVEVAKTIKNMQIVEDLHQIIDFSGRRRL